jgi:hypothetical protein
MNTLALLEALPSILQVIVREEPYMERDVKELLGSIDRITQAVKAAQAGK